METGRQMPAPASRPSSAAVPGGDPCQPRRTAPGSRRAGLARQHASRCPQAQLGDLASAEAKPRQDGQDRENPGARSGGGDHSCQQPCDVCGADRLGSPVGWQRRRAARPAGAAPEGARRRDQRVPRGRVNNSMNPLVSQSGDILERYTRERRHERHMGQLSGAHTGSDLRHKKRRRDTYRGRPAGSCPSTPLPSAFSTGCRVWASP